MFHVLTLNGGTDLLTILECNKKYRVFILNLDSDRSWTKSYDDQTRGWDMLVGRSGWSLVCHKQPLLSCFQTSPPGDAHLGEQDFDQLVLEHIKKGKDLRKDGHAVQKLRREVEKAKRALFAAHKVRGMSKFL